MALFKRRTAGKPGEWYYCLKHGTVEEGPVCRAADRFGPYATREEASHAMETAHERNLRWDTDSRWHDGTGGGSAGSVDSAGTGETDTGPGRPG